MVFLGHIIMDFNEMIMLTQKPFKKNAEPANLIFSYLQQIESLLDRLENTSEIEHLKNNFILDLKNKINSLKQTFASFKRSTQQGKGYASLNKKLPQIKKWLEQYASSIGEGNAGQLLTDFQRIAKIFEETLPEAYENYDTRVNNVLEHGNLFSKKVNAFLLQDEDLQSLFVR